MDIPAFYVPEFTKGSFELPEGEAHHASKVLRMNKGDQLLILDGKGKTGTAVISSIIKKKVVVDCDTVEQHKLSGPSIHLAIAPTKKWDRMAFLLEKLTEIGLESFTPVICQNSEQRFWKDNKAEQVVVKALKQSRNPFLPRINAAQSFHDFITQNEDEKLIAHCKPGEKVSLLTHQLPNSICIMIGPEGDFTQEEIEKAIEFGAKSISLGEQRMRTETAGLYSVISAFNKMKGQQ